MDRAQIPSEEPTVIIGVATGIQDAARTREYLDELDFLVQTAGGRVVRRFTQNLDHPDNRTYLGSVKLQEVRDFLEENGQVHTVVFDDELSTGQIRNIEAVLTGCKVIDRTRLILDIFSTRAQTAHAKIQVELAQYEYLLPRLTRMWTHLEKQRGGIGMRGPGEKEIETDRRLIRDRISLLKEKLAKIDTQKQTQRQNRGQFVRVALVGYTNVGKSTLMNLLSRSEVFAENKLFAFENNGMSGIRASGETRHNVILRCKAVNYLTLAFVTKYYTQEGIHFSFCHSNKLVLRDKGTKKFPLITPYTGLFFPRDKKKPFRRS